MNQNWKLTAVLAATVTAFAIASCSRSTSETVASATELAIDVLLEFATASIPLKKIGKLAALLTFSGGKAALKIETEVAKTGIKVGAAYPIYDVRSAVAEAIRQKTGRAPDPGFNLSFSGAAILIKYADEQHMFFVESTNFCVANIDEASLVWLDVDKRIVSLEVSNDVTDVRFSETREGCDEIGAAIKTRREENAINDLKNAMSVLDIKDGIISVDPASGVVEIEYQQQAGKVKSKFNPNILRAKHGINTNADLTVFRAVAQNKIDWCSDVALRTLGNDTSSLHIARADCLTKEGYDTNDQIYFNAAGLLSA